jgi:predicted transposase YbfD/YdcC
MQSTALAQPLAPLTVQERTTLLAAPALQTLQEAFTAIPDPRSRHGRRYTLAFLLTGLVAALLCNCNSLAAVSEWCADQKPLLAAVLGPLRHGTPTAALYRWVLARLVAEHVEWVLASWVQATLQAAPTAPLVADGKTVRGAATAAGTPHLLSFSTADTQETVLQVRVDSKTNEIPVVQEMLPFVPVAGRVFLADALHTQRATAAVVQHLGADYLLTVKENQPALYDHLATYFAAPTAPDRRARTVDRQRGRHEVRQLRATTEMSAYLAPDWPGVAQVARLVRTVTCRGVTSVEVVYLITSLTPRKASAKRLLALVRAYWSIENKHHYVRDETFGEDRSRLRTGDAPQIMAALRNLTLPLLHRAGCTRIAQARRHFAQQPAAALALLLPPLHLL